MPTTVLRILAALVLTVAAGLVSPASVAYACSCAGFDTDQAMQNASAVFDGTVIATSQPTSDYSAELIEYTIEVARVYQGSVPARVIVRSAVSGASCGAELTGDVTVFAQGPAEDLTTSLCSAPMTLDRSRLGAGYPPEAAPVPTPAPQSPTTTDFGLLIVGTLAGLLALIGITLWIVRRTRK